MTYEAGDVVVVPFPFTDRTATKRRPALVLSGSVLFGSETGQSVLAMITSAKQSAWPLDVSLRDYENAGLTTPCLVRMKLFTLDDRLIVRRSGTLHVRDRVAVAAAVKSLFNKLVEFDG